MAQTYCLLIYCIISLFYQSGYASIFGWFWNKGSDETTLVSDGIPLLSIPYESMTEDEKFLQEAAKFTEIQVSSPLETCQHKVIMKIKTSCSEMTEEQLAKLSVNLLNCQSTIEGRKIFPCTDEMVKFNYFFAIDFQVFILILYILILFYINIIYFKHFYIL